MSFTSGKVTPPYPTYLATVLEESDSLVNDLAPVSSPHAGAPTEVVDRIQNLIGRLTSEIVHLSHGVFDHPELCFTEYAAAEAVRVLVEAHGVPIEIGSFGLPTAFRAHVGDGRPTVAILVEYDALPGIGHGCGHNVICASGVGAFLALAEIASELPGSVELIGTPAEEGGSGKELILRRGGFDGIDAALMIHPGVHDVGTWPRLGMRTVNVSFNGLASHAAASPFLGRNALDGVVAAYMGIAQLRQHMLPGDRLHGVICNGGQQPNVVPSHASASFYVRSGRMSTMLELSGRVQEVFEASALMTGTSVDIEWDPVPAELPVQTNRCLMQRFAVNLRRRDRHMLASSNDQLAFNGSTDFGNVSMRVPGIHPTLAIAPPGVGPHSVEFAEHARGPDGDRACSDGAFALAATAADLFFDPHLRSAVVEEFAQEATRSTTEEGAPP